MAPSRLMAKGVVLVVPSPPTPGTSKTVNFPPGLRRNPWPRPFASQ
jgi:hypothetical protein